MILGEHRVVCQKPLNRLTPQKGGGKKTEKVLWGA